MRDLFGYQGKRVVITGAASGMGQATAQLLVELGAEVYALDINKVTAPVKQDIQVNLMQKDSIDAAVGQIPDNLYALFNCAGVRPSDFSSLEVALIQFVGHRHLTESLLPKMNNGGAIAFISTIGAIAWRQNLDTIKPLLATGSFFEARAWLEANKEKNDGYVFSKQCICAYVKTRAAELAKRNIRINCTLPGNTDTPFMGKFREDGVFDESGHVALSEKEEKMMRAQLEMIQPLCGRHATAEEQAEPLVFLNSNMARFISGMAVYVDFAYGASVEAGQSPNIWGL
jgi:NAD(P)-dependent dehydrogenase (short-subunit alcohol dehydrogenase family)